MVSGLGYLGAAGVGGLDAYNKQWEAAADQQGQIALGRTLQMLGAGGQQPVQPPPPQMSGGPPAPPAGPQMGGQPQGGSGTTMGMPPMGGPPNAFANRFPTSQPTPTGPSPVGPEAPMQAADPSRAGGYAALYAAMPQGQLPPQAQPAQYQGPGQQQGWGAQQGQGQPNGMPDIQQIAQMIARANPGAPPQVIANATQQFLKNYAPMMYRDAMLAYRGIGVGQRQEVVDAIKTRTNALYGPDSGSYFANRAGATATGRYGALTQPMEGGSGATPQSAMRTESVFSGGPEGRAVRSFNVVTQHLGVLQETVKALQNGDTQRLNQLQQTFAREFGSPVPTNFDAVKTIVTNEMNKAIIGGAGAVFDRAEIQSTMNKAQSPEQINGVIQNYIKLAAGQLNGLQKQYEAGTGKKDFDQRFISPATKALMGENLGDSGGSQPSGGTVIRYDAQGNRIGQ